VKAHSPQQGLNANEMDLCWKKIPVYIHIQEYKGFWFQCPILSYSSVIIISTAMIKPIQ